MAEMGHIYRLQNPVQEYAWGSRSAIADLLGMPTPSERPQAELWMGAHPKAPSMVETDGGPISLEDFIAGDPARLLGVESARRFDNQLPYLFKVLAAESPLSIQAHPDRKQAMEGFDRENSLGIALDAPERNYRDRHHKPELICALTPFWALNGFRPIQQLLTLLERLQLRSLKKPVAQLKLSGAGGLRTFFQTLMMLDQPDRCRAVRETVAAVLRLPQEDAVRRWIPALNKRYPDDVGVLAALLLNLVRLEPGEAMFLEAGELHAYLSGTAIELMANSDNVLRGGLTPKHVDIPELLSVLTFRDRTPRILHPEKGEGGDATYLTPAEEFVLSVILVSPGADYTRLGNTSMELLLCTHGSALVTVPGNSGEHRIHNGAVLMVPATVGSYTISGEGVVYRAGVPQPARKIT